MAIHLGDYLETNKLREVSLTILIGFLCDCDRAVVVFLRRSKAVILEEWEVREARKY